jgi:hypothetical protein
MPQARFELGARLFAIHDTYSDDSWVAAHGDGKKEGIC